MSEQKRLTKANSAVLLPGRWIFRDRTWNKVFAPVNADMPNISGICMEFATGCLLNAERRW